MTLRHNTAVPSRFPAVPIFSSRIFKITPRATQVQHPTHVLNQSSLPALPRSEARDRHPRAPSAAFASGGKSCQKRDSQEKCKIMFGEIFVGNGGKFPAQNSGDMQLDRKHGNVLPFFPAKGGKTHHCRRHRPSEIFF